MGNKKKVGIVAAMMVEPRLLILDEPFANLDPGSQLRLKAMLRELSEQHGTTMLISSHDLGHVTEICERITILDDGALVRDLPDVRRHAPRTGDLFRHVVDGRPGLGE